MKQINVVLVMILGISQSVTAHTQQCVSGITDRASVNGDKSQVLQSSRRAVFSPIVDNLVSVRSVASGEVSKQGSYLIVRLDEHSLSTNNNYVPSIDQVTGFQVSLTETVSTRDWREIRSSQIVPYDTSLDRNRAVKVSPSEFRVPIDGIELSRLGSYGLSLATYINTKGARTYSRSTTSIGDFPLERVPYDDGAFELSANGKQRIWLEKKRDSAVKFQFIETARTDYWISLYDPIRRQSVCLPRKEGRISESTNGRRWRDLYDVRIITAAPEKVTYDGGAFERFDRGGLPVWYETGKDYKPKFMFVETERKPEQITIFDVTRNFTIRLPTNEGMIALSVNNGVSWRDIYKSRPPRASSTSPIRLTPQEVMFSPSFNSTVAHSGSATLTSTGPFLVLKFSDYLIRTDDRNQGSTTRVVDIRFRLVSKKNQSDGVRLIRESEPFPLNFELVDRISRSVLLPDIKIPLDGIPFDELREYLLVADLRIRDGKVGVPSVAYPSIDPSRLL